MAIRGPHRRPGRPVGGSAAEGERRAAILVAAGNLFQQHGYAAVSMQDVAAAVGLTKAAVHYHFDTKADLYAAVMRGVLDRIQLGVRRFGDAPGTVSEKLTAMTTYVVVVLRPASDLDAMMRDAASHLTLDQRSAITEAHDGVHQVVADLMRDGIAAGELAPADPDVLAHAYLHLIAAFGGPSGVARGYPGRADIAAGLTALFLHGAVRGTADSPTGTSTSST